MMMGGVVTLDGYCFAAIVVGCVAVLLHWHIAVSLYCCCYRDVDPPRCAVHLHLHLWLAGWISCRSCWEANRERAFGLFTSVIFLGE